MRLTRPSFPANWVGFESMFSELDRLSGEDRSPNWPPYNIKKLNESIFVIELALSGYSENDVEITVKENVLVVKGDQPKSDESVSYLFQGIAKRSFSRTFTLADSVIVKSAAMVNGMLTVTLEKIIPAEKMARTIKIETVASNLLT